MPISRADRAVTFRAFLCPVTTIAAAAGGFIEKNYFEEQAAKRLQACISEVFMGTRTRERQKKTEFLLVSVLLSICLVTFGFPAYLWNLRYQNLPEPNVVLATTGVASTTPTVTAAQTETAVPSATSIILLTSTPTATSVPTRTNSPTVPPSASPTLTASSTSIPATATRRPRHDDPTQPPLIQAPPTSAPTQAPPTSAPTQPPPNRPPTIPTLIRTLLP